MLELQNYKNHIGKCITQLKVYRQRIQNFGAPDELETGIKSKVVTFVSMSFAEKDQDIIMYSTA